MSILDHKEDAANGVKVTVAPRSGRNVTYKITEAGFEAKGIRDLPPQAQIVWQVLTKACKDDGIDTFTLKEANELCEFLKETKVLETRQDGKRIFGYYRSLGARDGGNGYLSRRWLTIEG